MILNKKDIERIVGLRGECRLPASAVENSEPLRIATIALS